VVRGDRDRYVMEAQARCDELLELLSERQRDLLGEWLRVPNTVDLLAITHGPTPRTLTILAQPPSKDAKWLATKPKRVFLEEWLYARYWALQATNALGSVEIQDSQNQ